MSITIHIPAPLLRYSNDMEQLRVEGASIEEAFDALFVRLPALAPRLIDSEGHIWGHLILLLGTRSIDRRAWRGVRLTDGDELDIVPAIEGGQPSPDSARRDVRMRGFEKRCPFEEALGVALADLVPRTESVELAAGLAGRFLAEDVTSTVDVPPFDRSLMDGYAIRAEDSFGASDLVPVELQLCGESLPGAVAPPHVEAGQACRIMTGAPLPSGADAVVMAEDCEEHGHGVLILRPTSPAKHVGHRGEDIREGDVVLSGGRRLRPQDVGLLASIGHAQPTVIARPRVTILVTGNELLAPGSRPRAGFIVDSNTPMLQALVARDGGEVIETRHLPDDPDSIRSFLRTLECDVLLTVGGSSVGREDYLPQLVAELGELHVHGIAMRPSAPTGIGSIGPSKVFLLPGNPVSCLCAYDLLCGPALRCLGGASPASPYPRQRRKLSRRIASHIGRLDYVRLAPCADGGDSVQPIALGGASLLSSTTRALGFCLVPEDSEGLDAHNTVEVFFYDGAQAV